MTELDETGLTKMARNSGGGSAPPEATGLRWPPHTPGDGPSRVFRALGNPIRLRILWLLAHTRDFRLEDHPCCEEDVVCVCRIRALFDISAPDLSHHLKVLREADLVVARRIGIWTHYSLRSDNLEGVLEVLRALHANGHPLNTPGDDDGFPDPAASGLGAQVETDPTQYRGR